MELTRTLTILLLLTVSAVAQRIPPVQGRQNMGIGRWTVTGLTTPTATFTPALTNAAVVTTVIGGRHALSLAGVAARLSADIADFEATSTFSIHGWCWWSGTDSRFFSRLRTVSLNGYVLYSFNRLLYFELRGDSGQRIVVRTTSEVNLTNQWFHLAGTYSGTSTAAGVKIYVNGVPVAMTTVADNLGSTMRYTNPFYIGSSDGQYSFVGYISDFGILSRALAPADVKLIYRGLQ
jgi:hypothetical protein